MRPLVFARLDRLAPGDSVAVTGGGISRAYGVTSQIQIGPGRIGEKAGETERRALDEGASILILATCAPYGAGWWRLLVFTACKGGRRMRYRVAGIIPAHNEEHNIAGAVADLARQSHPLEYIVAVNDCSTDGTAHVLAELQRSFPRLVILENGVPRLRAGAVNRGLEFLRGKPVDLVVVADADSRFDRGLVEAAVECFGRYPRLGGVCSTSGVLPPDQRPGSLPRRLETWFLWRLQRLEGAGFDASRTATWRDVQILHGLCSVFDLRALLAVGGYTPGHMLEDYDLTLRLRRAGWWTMFCPGMRAWTRVPLTFKAFFRQRLRWMRGGVDILREGGIDRFTLGDFCQHLLFIVLFAGVVSHLVFNLIADKIWRFRFFLHPVPLALAVLGQAWSLYKLRFLDRIEGGDLALRLAVLPELAVAVVLSILQVRAYFLSLFGRPQEW